MLILLKKGLSLLRRSLFGFRSVPVLVLILVVLILALLILLLVLILLVLVLVLLILLLILIVHFSFSFDSWSWTGLFEFTLSRLILPLWFYCFRFPENYSPIRYATL